MIRWGLVAAICASVALSVAPTSVGPASAASGEVVIERSQNDVPYNRRCGAPIVTLYNASNTPVRSVSLLWTGTTTNGPDRYIRYRASKSWRTYPVYIAPGRKYKLRTKVCAAWRNTGGKYSFENQVYVTAVKARWTWD